MTTQLIQLSEEAESLADFLHQACELLGKSLRSASIEAGLSAGNFWNIVSGTTEHGDARTIIAAANYFKVPEGNLFRLAGYPSQSPSATTLKEAQEIYEALSEPERKETLRYMHLLLAARDTTTE